MNRLIREDNVHFGTFVYKYDAAGNILSKTAYRYTLSETLGDGVKTEYTYNQHGWKDQLIALNGKPFGDCDKLGNLYDALGNPKEYKGLKTKWQGRRLMQLADTTYTYDVNGIRTSKTANNITFNYIYDGNKLVAEQRVDQTTTKWLYYLYGVDGIAGFRYDGTEYLFRKNVQGDITHIYTVDGTLIAQYVYDAWGNCKVLTPTGKIDADPESIGNKNPFRYRGYYYDIDNKLYYLQTRYYDPEVGRFINADALEYLDSETLGGLNLYAYCGNNPAMEIDPEGTTPKWLKGLLKIICSVLIVAALFTAAIVTGGTVIIGAAVGAFVGAAVGLGTGIMNSIEQGGNWLDNIGDSMFSGTVVGALSGALAATSAGLEIQVLGNMLFSSGEYLLSSAIDGEQPTWEELGNRLVIGAVSGFFGGVGLQFGAQICVKPLMSTTLSTVIKLLPAIVGSSLAGLIVDNMLKGAKKWFSPDFLH